MTDAAARTTYARACAGYDEEFERALVAAITTAIAETSLATDAEVMMLRTGETASALLTVLAGVLAMSPAATRSPTATRKMLDDLHRKLRRQLMEAERSADVREFASRCFRNTDVEGSA
jgi:hypothetical protein